MLCVRFGKQATRAEPFDPFGDCLRCGVELECSGGFAQSWFDKSHYRLSTFRRQGSIAVAVHSGLSAEH